MPPKKKHTRNTQVITKDEQVAGGLFDWFKNIRYRRIQPQAPAPPPLTLSSPQQHPPPPLPSEATRGVSLPPFPNQLPPLVQPQTIRNPQSPENKETVTKYFIDKNGAKKGHFVIDNPDGNNSLGYSAVLPPDFESYIERVKYFNYIATVQIQTGLTVHTVDTSKTVSFSPNDMMRNTIHRASSKDFIALVPLHHLESSSDPVYIYIWKDTQQHVFADIIKRDDIINTGFSLSISSKDYVSDNTYVNDRKIIKDFAMLRIGDYMRVFVYPQDNLRIITDDNTQLQLTSSDIYSDSYIQYLKGINLRLTKNNAQNGRLIKDIFDFKKEKKDIPSNTLESKLPYNDLSSYPLPQINQRPMAEALDPEYQERMMRQMRLALNQQQYPNRQGDIMARRYGNIGQQRPYRLRRGGNPSQKPQEKETIHILGRKRIVHKQGRSKYIIYKKSLIKLSEAKKLEKQKSQRPPKK